MESQVERESMEFDVVIVGGGASGGGLPTDAVG